VSELRLDILRQRVSLTADDPEIAAVLTDVFGAFADDFQEPPTISLDVRREGAGFELAIGTESAVACPTTSALVHTVDKHLTIEVQRRRADLLFVHAAVLHRDSRALVLAGDSGHGKSTTAWALARNGFGFMSDELAPIDPRTRLVESYPRALGLKRVLPGLDLPTRTRHLERTIHVPVADLCNGPVPPRMPVSAVFFVGHDPAANSPQIVPLSAAETAARLYVLSLNALAHPAAGLDAVASVAAGVRGYALVTAGLEDTCTRIRTLLQSG
jgi:hypothetical protein